MIEKVILPKYDFLVVDRILESFTNHKSTYDVYFSSEELPSLHTQYKILSEVKRLFKMSGLDEPKNKFTNKQKVNTWFKDETMDGYFPAPNTVPL